MSIEKVEGEVVNKGYEDIVEEIRRKLERFCKFAHVDSRNLIVLIPRGEYNTLENTVLNYLIAVDRSKGHVTIFGAKLEPCQVDRIYVAYDEPEGSVYHE